MKTIRRNVFETNSSSTHSIAIPCESDASNIRCIYFNIGEFGWRFEEVDPEDYLYTGILVCFNKEEASKYVEHIKHVLDAHGIEYHFQKPKYYTGRYGEWLDNGSIDHSDDLTSFINDIMNDDNMLMRFLAGGRVFTGNDNSYEEESAMVNRNMPTYTEYNWRNNTETVHDNPYYIGEGYDWYFKGN